MSDNKRVICRFCGKLDIDWDEDCDGEGEHEPETILVDTCMNKVVSKIEGVVDAESFVN